MSGAGGMWDQLVEAIGEASAEALCREHGGTDLYISARPDGIVARVIGAAAAARLADAIGAGKLRLPMGPARGPGGRRRRVAKLLDAGASNNAAARAAGVHVRTVERIAAERRQEPGPLLALMLDPDKRQD